MNKQQAIERLDALESEAKKLREIINQPERTPEQRFWELILQTDSIKIDKRKYPDSTFGFMGGNFLWEYDAGNGYLWLSYDKIWGVLEKEYQMNYHAIKCLVKNQVEEHFKYKGVTPRIGEAATTATVEEHFKYKGVTPRSRLFPLDQWVEEHFKYKGVTPDYLHGF